LHDLLDINQFFYFFLAGFDVLGLLLLVGLGF